MVQSVPLDKPSKLKRDRKHQGQIDVFKPQGFPLNSQAFAEPKAGTQIWKKEEHKKKTERFIHVPGKFHSSGYNLPVSYHLVKGH